MYQPVIGNGGMVFSWQFGYENQKCFPTGQALGARKRCHYSDSVKSDSGVASATASKGVGSSVSHNQGQQQREFDMNMPALPEFSMVDLLKFRVNHDEEV